MEMRYLHLIWICLLVQGFDIHFNYHVWILKCTGQRQKQLCSVCRWGFERERRTVSDKSKRDESRVDGGGVAWTGDWTTDCLAESPKPLL